MIILGQIYQTQFNSNPPRAFTKPIDPQFIRWLQDNFEIVQQLCEFVLVKSTVPGALDLAQKGAIWIDNTTGDWYQQRSTNPLVPNWVLK